MAQAFARRPSINKVPVVPFVTDEIVYLSADAEDHYVIAQANTPLDHLRQIIPSRVSSRHQQHFTMMPVQRIDFMDVAPRQIVGISAALIPFLEHDDANRALMGSNMQRQAVPLLRPEISASSPAWKIRPPMTAVRCFVSDS